MDDNYSFDENPVLEPLILDSDFEKICMDLQNKNNFTSSNYFPTTLPYSDIENLDHDFSHITQYKCDGVYSMDGYNGLHQQHLLKMQKTPLVTYTNNLVRNENRHVKADTKTKDKIFYVRKLHTQNCFHTRNKCVFKVKRNKIKYLIQQDVDIFMNLISRFGENENSEIVNCKHVPLIINTKNRTFRLFHKDVIIKKIISNFTKFTNLFINSYFGTSKKTLSFEFLSIKISSSNTCSLEFCKIFLDKRLSEFILADNILELDLQNYPILNYKLRYIFVNIFLNSNYLKKYLIPRILSIYDEQYLSCFFNYINKIRDCL